MRYSVIMACNLGSEIVMRCECKIEARLFIQNAFNVLILDGQQINHSNAN